jgi:hypothetical protein
MEILGLAIRGFLALALTVIGILMVSKLSFFGLGPAVRSVGGKKFGMIIGIILIIVSVGATVTYVKSAPWKGAGSNLLGSASLTDEEAVMSAGITGLSCVFNSAPSGLTTTYTADSAASGAYFVADPDSLSHYDAYVLHDNGTRVINGTVSCTRQGDVEKAGRMECYIKGDAFKSETSTTDSNTYYILATSASASKVAGFPWAQTAYINDGSVATTASDREKTNVVFTGGASAQAVETVGYSLTLPGATPWSYLNNLTSNDVHIFCNYGSGDQEVAKITVTKVSA